MTRIFHEDAAALGCLPPTIEPRATEHMAPMLDIIARLIAKGHAYAADGHVLFDVPSMPAYGQLSRRPLDEMIAGARVEVAPYKRNPTDFVLWKPSSPVEPGWDSPFGRGRPGWHLECSAMSWVHLGETFDIHGGGIDLVFPHHENEVAQSCCAFGHPRMANVWMHNGHLQVEGEKMSKSLGNFVTIRDLWASDVFGGRRWSGDALRLALLRTHYRQPIDFTAKALEESERTLDDWRAAGAVPTPPALDERVREALFDDLNTPRALTELHELKARDPGLLGATLSAMGFALQSAEASSAPPIPVEEIEAAIVARTAARAAKDWAGSDRIRDELAAHGIVLKDGKDGTTIWSLKR